MGERNSARIRLETYISIVTFINRIWGLRKWRRLTSVLLRRLRISALFKIYVDGITLLFHPAAISMNLWEDSTKYKYDRDLFKKYLHEGDVCIDAGANVGLLTLVASKLVGTDGIVYSVEAHPRTFKYLKENLELNEAHNVRVYNTALGATVGNLIFSDEASDDINHVLPSGEGLIVPVTTLDILTSNIKEINLLKLDVEGYEWEVLKGANRALSTTQCIYFEAFDSQSKRYNHSSKDIIEMLATSGFIIFYPPKKDNVLRLISENHCSPVVENLLAVRNIDHFIQRTGYIFKRD